MYIYTKTLYLLFLLYIDDVTFVPILILYEISFECDFGIFSRIPKGNVIHMKQHYENPLVIIL